MNLLPDVTALPVEPLPRTHAPPKTKYENYRNCCRWDFGFTCSLCFLHESDFIECGAEGAGLIWIEHHELKSEDESQRDVYGNCILSCRFCNNNRSTRPLTDPETGGELLDPTSATWAAYFFLDNELVMRPLFDLNEDADYTSRAYLLDDSRKTKLRHNRRRRLAAFKAAEDDCVSRLPRLLVLAEQTTDPTDSQLLVETAERMVTTYREALTEIIRYEMIPEDKPERCRCDVAGALPPWLSGQSQEIQALP